MSVAIPYPEKIHISSTLQYKDSVSVIEFGDNYQQTIESGLNAQHEEWNIIYPALTQTELSTALAVFDSARSTTSITWTSPIYNVQKKYKIVKDSRRIDSLGAKWRLSLTMRQVFEP